MEIPVKSSTVYYSRGGTRTYFLDSNKNSILSENIKNNTVPFQFTTPENAAYVSIAYATEAFRADKNLIRLIEYSTALTPSVNEIEVIDDVC
jgi:hypothetical protein